MRLERVQADGRAACRPTLRSVLAVALLAAGVGGPGPSLAETESQGSFVDGSFTTRARVAGGSGNDQLAGRLALEWGAGHWRGGFTVEAENRRLESLLISVDGVGSIALPERWIGWSTETRAGETSFRLGTTYGVRFAEGLVLGSAELDGLELVADVSRRVRVVALAGRTDVVDPEDFWEEPWNLFPDELEPQGAKGELLGARTEVLAGRDLTLGVNLVAARGDGTPTAGLGSLDLRVAREKFDLSAELAARQGGGHALYVRTALRPTNELQLSVEHRGYRELESPLGDEPRYSGLSGAGEREENGWLVAVDWSPTRAFSATWSLDASESRAKDGSPLSLRDGRMALQFLLGERSALSYGVEHETSSEGHDGTLHSLLYTRSFAKGARLSARLSRDLVTDDPRDMLRVGCRVPVLGRRITFMLDDTLRRDASGTVHELSAGASIRAGQSSFVTLRGTLADDATESVDVTWYRRFHGGQRR